MARARPTDSIPINVPVVQREFQSTKYTPDYRGKLPNLQRGPEKPFLVGPPGPRGPAGPRGLDGARGADGLRGEDGTGIKLKGSKASTAALAAIIDPLEGDAYLIDGEIHIFDGTSWLNAGTIQGPAGPAGESTIPDMSGILFDGNRAIKRNITGLHNVTPGGANLEEFINNLLYPALIPVVNSNNITTPGNLETGVVTSVTYTVVGNSKDYSIDNIEISANDVPLTVHTPITINTPFSATATVSDATSNVTFSHIISGTGLSNITGSRTATFHDPFYYGSATLLEIQGLINSTALRGDLRSSYTANISAKGTKTYTFILTGNRPVIIYPAAYGPIALVKDENGYNITSSFLQGSTFTYTRADGNTLLYRICYGDTDNTVSYFDITFSF